MELVNSKCSIHIHIAHCICLQSQTNLILPIFKLNIYSRLVLDDQTERRDEGEAAAGELCWEISQAPVSPGKSPDGRILDYFTLQPSSTFSAF